MRDVHGLEPLDLLLAQRERLGRECVLDVLDLRCSHDRRCDAGLVQNPGERDLRGRDATLYRDFSDAVDDRDVEVRPVKRVEKRIGPGASR